MADPRARDHCSRFLELALRVQALRFGEFTLKSGRQSPYFFNAGRFDSGPALATLAGCYADAIDASGVHFDCLFGPAYKGIPLATALAGRRVLVVDDVITAGTAVREALATIGAAGGEVTAIAIALDRQEAVSVDDPRSAAQALAADAGLQVIAVATLGDLLAFAGESADLVAQREPLQAYRARYGCRTGAAS